MFATGDRVIAGAPEQLVALEHGRTLGRTDHHDDRACRDEGLRRAAQTAGATLVVGETALLTHLPGLLEQALRVE